MQKRNKFGLILVGEIAFLAIIFVVLPAIFIKERPGVSQTSLNETLSLDTKNSFLQEVVSNRDNLRSVSVLLKNPGLINKDQVIIELQDASQNTLHTLNTSGISIGDPSWINFEFPAVNSKKGDRFFIKITTANQQPDHLFVYGSHSNKNINFKTTYTANNLKESLKNNLEYQKNQIKERSTSQIIVYIAAIVLLNTLLFLSL